jgi:hypothetical protein
MSVGKSRLRGDANVKRDLEEIGSKFVIWVHLPQERNQWRELINIRIK